MTEPDLSDGTLSPSSSGGSSGTGDKNKAVCKWFNVTKGWGFLTPVNGSQEVFVHQSVLFMAGFRSLGDSEAVEYECKISDKGLEATLVTGPGGLECTGSNKRPMKKSTKKKPRKIRCYNCGDLSGHIASKCSQGPMPKKCHGCKMEDHLIRDCPNKVNKVESTEAEASSSESGDIGVDEM